MADSSAPEVASKLDEAQSRAKILEGVDFIETEEDAEAVESAVVRIQSTFRGKKIRSKLNQKPAAAAAGTNESGSGSNQQQDKGSTSEVEASTKAKPTTAPVTSPTTATAATTTKTTSDNGRLRDQDEELNNKVATMQVNDNSGAPLGPQDSKHSVAGSNAANLPKEELAATKIQAGFKGYKTRKELESKLGQQAAPAADGQAQGSMGLVKGD